MEEEIKKQNELFEKSTKEEVVSMLMRTRDAYLKLQGAYEEMVAAMRDKRLDYLLKIIELKTAGAGFSNEFVEKIVSSIENTYKEAENENTNDAAE